MSIILFILIHYDGDANRNDVAFMIRIDLKHIFTPVKKSSNKLRTVAKVMVMNEVLRKTLKEKKFKLEIDTVVDCVSVGDNNDDLLGDDENKLDEIKSSASYNDLLSPSAHALARKSVDQVSFVTDLCIIYHLQHQPTTII